MGFKVEEPGPHGQVSRLLLLEQITIVEQVTDLIGKFTGETNNSLEIETQLRVYPEGPEAIYNISILQRHKILLLLRSPFISKRAQEPFNLYGGLVFQSILIRRASNVAPLLMDIFIAAFIGGYFAQMF